MVPALLKIRLSLPFIIFITFFYKLCVCVCVWEGICTHMCAFMQRPEEDAQCLTLLFSPIFKTLSLTKAKSYYFG